MYSNSHLGTIGWEWKEKIANLMMVMLKGVSKIHKCKVTLMNCELGTVRFIWIYKYKAAA